MGQGVESLGSLMFKKLSGEAEHIGKAISKQAPDFTKAIAKEVDQYPPVRVDFENMYRNGEWDEIQRRGQELMENGKVKEAQEEMGGVVNMNNPTPAAQPQYPTSYDVKGKEGRDYVHGQLSNWLKEQQGLVDSGQIKKIDRSQFAPEGLVIDGQERGISGITEHIKSGYQSRIKMDSLGPALARAKQQDPQNVPGLKEWFDEGNERYLKDLSKNVPEAKRRGIHPDLSFEEFRSAVTRGAAKADEVTSELAKEFGIKLDKEHMRSLGDLGSNDPRSQVPGSAKYNRTMGKIDSFNKEVMEILGLPSSGDAAAAKAITGTGPSSTKARNIHRQKGWWQSATDWVGSDGGTMDDMSQWNPGDLLTDVDKLRIQQQPGANQAKLAQQILAERQILQAYIKAGLGKTPKERALLGRILKHIDAKTAFKKALAEAKESMPESQLEDLARKYPMEKREQLMERANKSLSSRTTQSKLGIHKPKLIKLDRKGNVIPPKELTEVSPGVAVGPNYKPGRDPAVDALLQKLARDGADSLDSSGINVAW